jgi:hypothetical protein
MGFVLVQQDSTLATSSRCAVLLCWFGILVQRAGSSTREPTYVELEQRDKDVPCSIDRRPAHEITQTVFQQEYLHKRPLVIAGGSALLGGEMGVGEVAAVIRSMLDDDYASLQVRTGHPEELIRGGGFGEHKMELSKFMSQKYTEADPYYLFQHDLLDRMPKIKRFFKRCGPAQGTIRQRSLSRTQELLRACVACARPAFSLELSSEGVGFISIGADGSGSVRKYPQLLTWPE